MSDYTATIKLEVFLQRFLCRQFQQTIGEDFRFPARHNFNILLEFLVMKPPRDYVPQDYGEETFRVVIPQMEYKNIATYNYLSKNRQLMFVKKVKEYLYTIFNDDLSKAVRKFGFTRQDAIDYLKEEYGFTEDDYDRLLKEYQRWYKKETMRRYRGRKKEKKKLSAR